LSGVVDTSALIALSHLHLLRLLKLLFDDVIIPQAVLDEWLQGDEDALDSVSAAEGLRPGWLQVRSPGVTVPDALTQWLGRGEAEVMSLAQSSAADFVVMDDRVARMTAGSIGLRVIGTVGVLVAARRRGIIPAVLPLLEVLQRPGFRLSDEVIDAVRREEEA